jgi:ferredoxin-nitrite reductase
LDYVTPVDEDIVMSGAADFTKAQKEYLQGFSAGLAALGALPALGVAGIAPASAEKAETWFGLPLDEITNEERLKREENPLDIWAKMMSYAAAGAPPQEGDIFRFKFHGLFYVAPAQDGMMVRVRVPGNVLRSYQLRALAGIARELGGGYGDVTTRGNVQIREIAAANTIEVLMRLAEAGLTSCGSGVDNVRNVTASPLAGLDPSELIDVGPLARAMQFYLTHHRDLFGLPRKFNISFDGGGRVSVVTDTNDIGFIATRAGAAAGVAEGIYFRVWLAGITGHQRFAEDCGLLLAPDECVAVAAAMLRVYAEHGDRTDRKKARLCYLLDRMGVARFLELTQEKLGRRLRCVAAAACSTRAPVDKHGHLGIQPQQQAGLYAIGIAMPLGRMRAAQMDALAQLADDCGSGELRLTVWQNILIPNVPAERVETALQAIRALGYEVHASSLAGCVVACTGNTGCNFAATDTKGQALALVRFLETRLVLDRPLNIHLTGCPHSCAQHYIADIGLLGAKVPQGEGSIAGYHVYVGGGVEQERGLGQELAKNVPFDILPELLERLLSGYLATRAAGEPFVDFVRRHDIAQIKALAGVQAS